MSENSKAPLKAPQKKFNSFLVFGSTLAAATAIPIGLALCGGTCSGCGLCIVAAGALPVAVAAGISARFLHQSKAPTAPIPIRSDNAHKRKKRSE